MTFDRRISRAIGAFLVVGTISVASASAGAQTQKFDGREWAVGNRQENRVEILTEYVLPGQTVENWRELVTSSVFQQAVPLEAFVEKVHTGAARGCPSLVWNLIQ